MSNHVKHWEHESAEAGLEWLFDNSTSWLHADHIHIWTGSFATLDGGNLTGGYGWVSRKMLEGRVYSVSWSNDSVAICFHDQVFIDRIQNRSYPDETRCIKARLPFIATEVI
jgi:hypothetical protein